MSELIQGLVNVRDGLSLIAFLSLVLLGAFRTQKVPDLFFGLVRDKLTRQQFAALLNRFMTLAFVAFLVLATLAALAQVLNYMTQPGGLTLGDLRNELARLEGTVEQKIQAEAEFNLAMTHLAQRDFDRAIASLEASISAIPTLTAEEMVTFVYRLSGDFEGESRAWQRAVNTAREAGNAVALVRLDRVGSPSGIPDMEGENDLIGERSPLPDAGTNFDSAEDIALGLYECISDDGCFERYYSIDLRTGQALVLRLRSPTSGGLAGAGIYSTNGQFQGQAGNGPFTARGNAGPMSTIHEVEWVARSSGAHFIRISSDGGTVFRIDVR